MKRTYILLAIFLFSFCKPMHSQSDAGNVFDGLQSTLTNTFSDFTDTTDKAKRLYMLFRGDIGMMMYSKDVGDDLELEYRTGRGSIGSGFYFRAPKSEDKLFINFDMDNKAQIMVGKSNGGRFEYGDIEYFAGGFIKVKEALYDTTSKNETTVQFTDKDGYWYVPVETESGNFVFVKFDAKKMALGVLGDLQKLSTDIMANDFALALIGLNSTIKLDNIDLDHLEGYTAVLGAAIANGTQSNFEMQEKLKEAIKILLNKRFSQIGGFPIFIHWAFMYSPNVIKAKFKVDEKKINLGNGYYFTRLTITSGPEKGKFMIFDKYNRLLYIDAGKDGYAEYFYDRDFTVTIPSPSYKMSDITSGKVILRQN